MTQQQNTNLKSANNAVLSGLFMRVQNVMASGFIRAPNRYDTSEMRAIATVLTAHADAMDRARPRRVRMSGRYNVECRGDDYYVQAYMGTGTSSVVESKRVPDRSVVEGWAARLNEGEVVPEAELRVYADD